jgi:chromosome segregation ATPase
MAQVLRNSIEANDGQPDYGQPDYADTLELRQLNKLKRALHLHIPELEKEFERERHSERIRDVEAAVELIRQASNSNRVLEDRTQELKAELDSLAERSARDLELSQSLIEAAEARARAAEAKTLLAEQRLGEAEERLRQIIDVIGEELAGRTSIA